MLVIKIMKDFFRRNTLKLIPSTTFLLQIMLVVSSCSSDKLPAINEHFDHAIVKTEGNKLIVSTGKFSREWLWTGSGLTTTSAKNMDTGKEWADQSNQKKSDWAYFGVIDDNTPGELISLKSSKGNDDGFTSDHLEVLAEVNYPSVETSIKYQIWVYPDAPGVFTRVWIKNSTAREPPGATVSVE